MKELNVSSMSSAKDTVGFATIILQSTPEGETVAKLSGNPQVVEKYTKLFKFSDEMLKIIKELSTLSFVSGAFNDRGELLEEYVTVKEDKIMSAQIKADELLEKLGEIE